MPLRRLLDATAPDQTMSLAEAIALLANSLSPTPSLAEVVGRTGLLTARLHGASTVQVFATADRLRDTLVARFPTLRDAQGHLSPAAQQALGGPSLPQPTVWSDEHREAWRRGLMPVQRRRVLALRPTVPEDRPAQIPVVIPGPTLDPTAVPGLDLMDLELLADALGAVSAASPASDDTASLSTLLRPFAYHLTHLPPGRCYVLARAFREAVAERRPACVMHDEQGRTRLEPTLCTTLFALTLNGDDEDDAHDQAMGEACLPGHSTPGTIARWVREAVEDVRRTSDLVARMAAAPLSPVARVNLAQALIEHLDAQGSAYRELLVLDRLRPTMAEHPELRRTMVDAMKRLAPARHGALRQMWWEDQRLTRAFALAQARSCAPGTPLVAPETDDPASLAETLPETLDNLCATMLHDLPAENDLLTSLARLNDDASGFLRARIQADPDIVFIGDLTDLDDPFATPPAGPTDPVVPAAFQDPVNEDGGSVAPATLRLVDQMQGLDAVAGLLGDLLETPVVGHADLMGAIGHLVRTTDTWNDAWFELAWHGVITQLLPRWTPHIVPPMGPYGEPDDLAGVANLPAPQGLSMLTLCTMTPGALARRASAILRVGPGLDPQAVLSRRLLLMPLHDPLVETATLLEARRQEQLEEQRQQGTLVKVVDAPIREFRNSAVYTGLAKGLALKPVGVDLDAWQDAMDADFPWMRPLTARLARRLAIQRQHHRPVRLPNLALLGDPGVGKTLYWRTAMRRLDHPLTVLAMAGTNDSMLIKGTTAGWSTERPGLAAHAMATSGLANPVVLLDEIDKAGGGDNNGRAVDALLPLMEASTASTYRDDCLLQEVDASHISWVLTLNEEDKLPAALRSRVEIVTVHGPDWSNPEHVAAVLRLGEDLAWLTWGQDLRTPATALSDAQKDGLRRTRWTSLRSLGQAIEGLVEDNLYQATVEARLRAAART